MKDKQPCMFVCEENNESDDNRYIVKIIDHKAEEITIDVPANCLVEAKVIFFHSMTVSNNAQLSKST